MSVARRTRRTGDDAKRSAMAAVMPLWELPMADLGKTFKNAIVDLLSDILKAIVANLLGFFSDVIKEFLFFPRPSTVSGLESVQQKATVVFAGLLLIGWLLFLLDIQIFPYNTKSDPYRLLERSFAGVVLVVAGPLMLDYAVVLTSAIGQYFYPGDLGQKMASIAASNPGGSILALALLYAVGTTLILIVAGFFVVLSIRMFLVYVLFALLPLFAAFWIFDTGVGKYTKKTADMFFKTTAMILVAGILISAVLQVGVSLADTGSDAFSGDTSASDFSESSTNSTEMDSGEMCFEPLKFGDLCVLSWSKLFAFIGIGGAMTVSTTVAMLGVGTLMGGGGMGSVAGGAVGGLAAGAVGKATSAVGGGDSGGDEPGGGEPGPGEAGGGGGGAPAAQLESPDSHGAGAGGGGGAGSGSPRADLGSSGSGGTSTVSTPRSGGGAARPQGTQAGGRSQQQQDKSLLDKTAEAADAGSKIGGVVGKVDPAMGAAVTAAAGAYKFHQEGGFSDVKQATADAGKMVSETVTDVKNSFDLSNPNSSHKDSGGEGGVSDQTNQYDVDWQSR